MNLKQLSILATTLLLSSSLYGEEKKLDLGEVQSYALQKYRVDFTAQTEKSKQDIANEYAQNLLIHSKIAPLIAHDTDFKVASMILGLEVWAKKFMAYTNPTEEELKKLYIKEAPKIAPRYNLRNILTQDDTAAQKLLKKIETQKEGSKRLEKFKEIAKNESLDITTKANEGAIGYIDHNKLDKKIQEALKGKKLVISSVSQWKILARSLSISKGMRRHAMRPLRSQNYFCVI